MLIDHIYIEYDNACVLYMGTYLFHQLRLMNFYHLNIIIKIIYSLYHCLKIICAKKKKIIQFEMF